MICVMCNATIGPGESWRVDAEGRIHCMDCSSRSTLAWENQPSGSDIIAQLAVNAELGDLMGQIQPEVQAYDLAVEDAKRHFGQWDMCDPVVLALIAVVQAQNSLAYAISEAAAYGNEGELEPAIAARIEAIKALQKAIEEEPRGFQ